jgi:hypothetical protein
MTTAERQTNFRILNPITATTREIAEVLNRTIDGGLNSVGYVTLQANVTSTTVSDARYNVESLVFFASQGHTPDHFHPYVDSTSTNGTLVIGHNNHGHTQRFGYLIIG